MTSTTAIELGDLSEYLPHQAHSLGFLVEVHVERLADHLVDTHLDLLDDDVADDLREKYEAAHEVDYAGVERDLEAVIRTRLRSVGVDLVDGRLVGRVPHLSRDELRPVILRIINTTNIATLFDLHMRPV
ncbi:hypothetical protein SAMN04488074_13648 [Lentzea albidocapillata subsp. violacea]|uniref:Uncharacterized protein n=1 Tax=Lentzea albidocapillata subsp. violacea TaxID=128104 RepID=A0A1G9Z1V1_9PSEU|nr:hypothetical protein [Lentzea albidocapillata]SDN14693.1 hypothetical protein SAMN04488074_13648 [Lentzea albidocapillata subsp. violacea]